MTTTNSTVQTFEVEMTNDGYGHSFKGRLRVEGSNNWAGWLIGCIPAGEEARRVSHGPMVPGPWAWTSPMASVLSAEPAFSTGAVMEREKREGRLIDAKEGDVLIMCGDRYVIGFCRRGFVTLTLMCESCDCADPLALPGLAAECDCACHAKGGAQ